MKALLSLIGSLSIASISEETAISFAKDLMKASTNEETQDQIIDKLRKLNVKTKSGDNVNAMGFVLGYLCMQLGYSDNFQDQKEKIVSTVLKLIKANDEVSPEYRFDINSTYCYEQTAIANLIGKPTIPGGVSPELLDSYHEAVLTIATKLLDKGANPNDKDMFGKPLLHSALDPNLINLLVQRGAEVDRPDPLGRSPLNHIINLGLATSLATALLNNRADYSLRNKDGQTPLHLAANSQNYELVEALLSRGVNPREEDGGKRNALFYLFGRPIGYTSSTIENRRIIFDLLLSNGASPINSEGKKLSETIPFSTTLAENQEMLQIVKALEEKMEKATAYAHAIKKGEPYVGNSTDVAKKIFGFVGPTARPDPSVIKSSQLAAHTKGQGHGGPA